MNTPPTPEAFFQAVCDAKAEAQGRGIEPRFLYLGGWQVQALNAYMSDQAARGYTVRDPNVLGKPTEILGLQTLQVNKDDHLAVS